MGAAGLHYEFMMIHSCCGLRELPTPVILDQARERAALSGKNETVFSDDLCPTPFSVASGGTDRTDR